ncbi:MAG: NTP transferase domain-containing protein [Chloroflexi bacterium]|nr:NTP transferase domain-containing protein [Chloroflexota bacterium]
MDCIIAAGGVPKEEDLLYSYTQGKPKALLDMHGRTMLERVVDAMQSARQIDDIVIVGLGDDMGQQFQRPVHHVPGRGGLVSNVLAGVDWINEHKPDTQVILVSSSDIPLLTGEMVDAYIDRCRPFEYGMHYNFIAKETMETRFPDSRRTFTKLKDAEVAGGDMHIISPSFAYSNRELWETLAAGRKKAWKLARAVGFRVLFKLLTRRLSFADIEALILKLTDHRSKILLNPHAEIAMDGDKPHQVDILREEIKRITNSEL